MFSSFAPDPPIPSTLDAGGSPVPDPWETFNPSERTSQSANRWPTIFDIHHLISPAVSIDARLSPAGAVGALLLPIGTPTTSLSPTQVLLQDELKLRSCNDRPLAQRVEVALALLSWMGAPSSG